MSEYIMDPGARLEIVGGKPYEELGACCAQCAKNGIGDVKTIPANGGTITMPPGGSARPPSTDGSALPLLLGLGAVGAIGVVGFLVVRRLRRKRR